MSILGNKNNLIDEKPNNDYTLPVMVTKDEEKIPLKRALLLSAILHPTAMGLAWLISFLLLISGISVALFAPPQPKQNDIEFVLVDNLKEQTPKNKKTKLVANKTLAASKED